MPATITTKIVTANPVAVTPPGGTAFRTMVAVITDSQLSDPASDFITSINWGDGTPLSTGTLIGGSGLFVLEAPHAYATTGNFTLTAAITYVPSMTPQTASATVNVVTPQPFVTNSHPLYLTSNQLFDGPVADFIDSNSSDTRSSFAATVNWGDGTVTNSIVIGSNGSFLVSDAHTYTTPGVRGVNIGPELRLAEAIVSEEPSDFSGRGSSSILWRQDGGGLAIWQMGGAAITSSGAVTAQGAMATPDSTWSIGGIGDFDGSGTADVLWRQSTTGVLVDWSMRGNSIASSNVIGATPDASWTIADVADFSGDGKADILWRQGATGTLALWLMNGAAITRSVVIDATPDSSWSIAGSGDFNGDGISDLLWRQSGTGVLVDWSMDDSGNIISSSVVAAAPDASWSVAGVADFNADGTSDVLWRQNGSGALALWSMNGSTIMSSQQINASPDSTWSIVEIGNFGDLGKPDLIWRQSTTGTLNEWMMEGANIFASTTLGASPDASWNVQSRPTNLAGV